MILITNSWSTVIKRKKNHRCSGPSNSIIINISVLKCYTCTEPCYNVGQQQTIIYRETDGRGRFFGYRNETEKNSH